MARETRTVKCPHCGAEKTTRAFGGVALKCDNDECAGFFQCPRKEPTGRRAKPTAKPAPKPEDPPAQGGGGGVKVRRAKGVKATAPEPPADDPPPDDGPPAEPDPAATPRRTRPKSHRRSWGRR